MPRTLRIKTNDPHESWYLRPTIKFSFGDHPAWEGDRKVNTEYYAFTLSKSEDLKPAEFSWEWDPTGHDEAHVHVGRKDKDRHGLGKLHIPTARVTFEQVVKFALHDLGGLPHRSMGNTDEERMEVALAILNDAIRRVQKFGTGRR
jgi:hypothetical protein